MLAASAADTIAGRGGQLAAHTFWKATLARRTVALAFAVGVDLDPTGLGESAAGQVAPLRLLSCISQVTTAAVRGGGCGDMHFLDGVTAQLTYPCVGYCPVVIDSG